MAKKHKVALRGRVVSATEKDILGEWIYIKRRSCSTRSRLGLWLSDRHQSGFSHVHAPGPIDKGWSIQLELPIDLVEFCTAASGNSGSLSSEDKQIIKQKGLPLPSSKPKGIRWSGYDTAEDAARDFAHMMDDPEYFIRMVLYRKTNKRWYEV